MLGGGCGCESETLNMKCKHDGDKIDHRYLETLFMSQNLLVVYRYTVNQAGQPRSQGFSRPPFFFLGKSPGNEVAGR